MHKTEGPLVVSLLKTPVNVAADDAAVQNIDSNSSSFKTKAQRFRVLVWSKYVHMPFYDHHRVEGHWQSTEGRPMPSFRYVQGEKQALVAWSQRLLGASRPPGKRLLKYGRSHRTRQSTQAHLII